MAIALKSPSEIAKLREANLVVAEVLDVLESSAKAS
jgi:methionine aminopeptidase